MRGGSAIAPAHSTGAVSGTRAQSLSILCLFAAATDASVAGANRHYWLETERPTVCVSKQHLTSHCAGSSPVRDVEADCSCERAIQLNRLHWPSERRHSTELYFISTVPEASRVYFLRTSGATAARNHVIRFVRIRPEVTILRRCASTEKNSQERPRSPKIAF